MLNSYYIFKGIVAIWESHPGIKGPSKESERKQNQRNAREKSQEGARTTKGGYRPR